MGKYMKRYREEITYLIIGILTTFVNWLVYYFSYYDFYLSNMPSNILAWVVSVAFAFVMTKKIVFQDHKNESRYVAGQLVEFVTGRLATGLLEIILMSIFVTQLKFNAMVMKLVISSIVIVMNYMVSKKWVFVKRECDK
ncbi:MAG: GtrA family protein [Hespellia sp.]|nr:GtrA family protein [Hespellia sp.]